MNKKLLALLVIAALALGGIGAAVAAQAAADEAGITGTIEVPVGSRLGGLADLATVSEADAIGAAQAALADRGILEAAAAPSEVELEVENGFLVWEVEFPGWEVVVDAGSAEVLLIEDESAEDDDAMEEEAEEGEDDAD